MEIKNLDVSSLEKAVLSLDQALKACEKESANTLYRDASIQRFEYTYELCHKLLKRYLEITEPNAEEIDQMAFSMLIRTASEKGLLLNDWEKWRQYRHARNMTSHVYDEKKALEVYTVIPAFLNDAQYLLNQLKERIKAS